VTAVAERFKIRHRLPPARWPTREEAAGARLFQPARIGGIVAEQRTWVPAMVPWRATEDGFVTDDVLAWYARFAEGRPGVLVVEATGIRDVASGPLLRIGDDRFVPGLRRLVETVRDKSAGHTRLFIQAIDFVAVRRRPEPEKFLRRFLDVDASLRRRLADATGEDRWVDASEAEVRERLVAAERALLDAVLDERQRESMDYGYRERIWDTHLPHIRDLPHVLPGLFAEAGRRAREAGFDGIELHYAHAYTMASFLSRLNTRDDGYGGPREHRVRLPLEVLRAVRGRVGHDYVVGIRYLGDDVVAGGSDVEDAAWFGARFAEAGVDYLSVSKGGRFEDAKQPRVGEAVYPYTGRSGYECMPTVISDERGPFGRNVPLAARIRRAVRETGLDTPVVTSGGIGTFEQAEAVLERGDADFVGAARQSLADPDWFRKIQLGYGHLVRRCEFTNYCEGLDQQHKQVTCKLWDRVSLDEPSVRLARDGKRRLSAPSWSPPPGEGPLKNA
jgi:2,4-dienoyl-CoA reductase-like NADH-dependent reductase (Old Yellow Enzyme family)